MCGIAGIFHPDVPKPVDPARVEAMTDALAHRGPDGSGVWTAPGVGLGHRRLSIIDLSDAAAQPMLTPDRRLALTYNGEIYNFREVRAELEAKGHVFATQSDTEVILAGWRQWGLDCLERFNGMFAFALYDAAERFTRWKQRHLMAVWRSMGEKTGSAGTSGAEWLARGVHQKYLPELWNVRTEAWVA